MSRIVFAIIAIGLIILIVSNLRQSRAHDYWFVMTSCLNQLDDQMEDLGPHLGRSSLYAQGDEFLKLYRSNVRKDTIDCLSGRDVSFMVQYSCPHYLFAAPRFPGGILSMELKRKPSYSVGDLYALAYSPTNGLHSKGDIIVFGEVPLFPATTTVKSASGKNGLHFTSEDSFDEILQQSIIDRLGIPNGSLSREILRSVEALRLDSCRIRSLQGIGRCQNLRKLDLRQNEIVDLTPLSQLQNLEELILSENAISDVSALSHLKNLESLTLSHNTITDLRPLRELSGLRMLWMRSNLVVDVAPLVSCPRLEVIYLSFNRINTVRPFLSIESCPHLRKLVLYGNPLSLTAIDREVVPLRSRGIAVLTDQRGS